MDITWEQGGAIAIQLAMGISLAASAGLRAFLPLFVVGLAGRFDVIPLTSSFDWLASTPALIVFGVAVVFELLADKIPLVDNFLDIVQTGVKPVAGTVLVASVLTDLTPLQSVVLGIVLGGGAAGIVHLLKAKLRFLSTAASAGVGNPVLSVAEDSGALLGSLGAIFVPILVFLVLVVFFVLAVLAIRRLRQGAPRAVTPIPH